MQDCFSSLKNQQQQTPPPPEKTSHQRPVWIQQFLLRVLPHRSSQGSRCISVLIFCSSRAAAQPREETMVCAFTCLAGGWLWVESCLCSAVTSAGRVIQLGDTLAVGCWRCSPHFRFTATQAKVGSKQHFGRWSVRQSLVSVMLSVQVWSLLARNYFGTLF